MAKKEVCPSCGGNSVSERRQPQTFLYGDTISEPLTAIVPVLHCEDCDENWTDYRGEDARNLACFMYLRTKTRIERTAKRKALRSTMTWWEFLISPFKNLTKK